jgi:hypothetical protein
MSEEKKQNIDEMSPVYQGLASGNLPNFTHATDEYKVGHHKPPLFLVVLYVGVIIWCAISWIPFYGY